MIQPEFTAELVRLEQVMNELVKTHTNDSLLQESMQYSVQAGGKRIRPLLVFSSYSLYQKPFTQGVYEVAAAVELVHTYSLIHDDLPAMDDDQLRRGKPTNHVVFGEAVAILAGDGLLTLAFDVLAHAEISDTQKIACIQLLARMAGTAGMVAGQAADIQAEGKQLTLSELKLIHAKKTGDLIRFALLSGAILGGATKAEYTLLDLFAGHIGLAFQIRDDLLDVLATTEELGKTAHRDEALAKSTYPQLLGVAPAKEALMRELKKAQQIITELEAKQCEVAALQAIIKKFEL